MRIALLPLASARWNGQLTASDETGVEHVEHLIQKQRADAGELFGGAEPITRDRGVRLGDPAERNGRRVAAATGTDRSLRCLAGVMVRTRTVESQSLTLGIRIERPRGRDIIRESQRPATRCLVNAPTIPMRTFPTKGSHRGPPQLARNVGRRAARLILSVC